MRLVLLARWTACEGYGASGTAWIPGRVTKEEEGCGRPTVEFLLRDGCPVNNNGKRVGPDNTGGGGTEILSPSVMQNPRQMCLYFAVVLSLCEAPSGGKWVEVKNER